MSEAGAMAGSQDGVGWGLIAVVIGAIVVAALIGWWIN